MFLKSINLKEEIISGNKNEPQVIIEDGDRKIIFFDLDKEKEISEHFSPVDAAVYVIKGCISIFIEEKEYVIKKNEMFLIPNNKKHSVTAIDKSRFLVIRV